MPSFRVPAAFVVGAALGVLVAAIVPGFGSPSVAVVPSSPPGVDGTHAWVDGDVVRFDAANGTLYVDTARSGRRPLPVNVTDRAVLFRCSSAGGGLNCTPASWGTVSPGSPVCADVVLAGTAPPRAGKTFLGAACGGPAAPPE